MPNRQPAADAKGTAAIPTDKEQHAATTRRPQADSFITRLVNLAPGDSDARVKRMEDGAAHREILREAGALRSVVSSQISKAKLRLPEANYSMSSGEIRAQNGDILIVVTVSRVD